MFDYYKWNHIYVQYYFSQAWKLACQHENYHWDSLGSGWVSTSTSISSIREKKITQTTNDISYFTKAIWVTKFIYNASTSMKYISRHQVNLKLS